MADHADHASPRGTNLEEADLSGSNRIATGCDDDPVTVTVTHAR